MQQDASLDPRRADQPDTAHEENQATRDIARDLNNALAVIIISFENIKRTITPGESKMGQFIDTGYEAATRGAALSHRLLEGGREDTGSAVKKERT